MLHLHTGLARCVLSRPTLEPDRRQDPLTEEPISGVLNKHGMKVCHQGCVCGSNTYRYA
jgi:hypothetical protein